MLGGGGANPYGCGMSRCTPTPPACGDRRGAWGHRDSKAWGSWDATHLPPSENHEFRMQNCPSCSMLGEGWSGRSSCIHSPISRRVLAVSPYVSAFCCLMTCKIPLPIPVPLCPEVRACSLLRWSRSVVSWLLAPITGRCSAVSWGLLVCSYIPEP